MFCNSCGTFLPDGSVFCSQCGSRQSAQFPRQSSGVTFKGSLISRNQPETAKPTPQPYIPPEPIPAYNPQPNVPAYSAPEVIPAYGEAPVVHRPSGKKKLTWLWILLALAAAAGIAIGILFATGVLGQTRYCFVEEAVCFDGDGNREWRLDVELNDDGYPEIVTRRIEGSSYSYSNVTELTYDSDHNVIAEDEYYISPDGTKTKTSSTEYNEYGDKVKETIYSTSGELVVTKYDRTYDRDGNETECQITCPDGGTERDVYEYDKNGNCIEHVHYEDGEKNYRCVYEYDNKDNLTSVSYTDYEEPFYNYEAEYENEYDGDLLEKQIYHQDGEKYCTRTYEYDRKDNITEEQIEYADGTYEQYEYEYDDEDRLVEKTFSCSWSSGDSRYEYEYDNDGNMVEYRYYGDGDLIKRIEYSYFDKAMKLSDAQKAIFAELDVIYLEQED